MLFRVLFWDILPCKMIVDRRFRGAYCLHNQGWVDNHFTRLYIPEDNSEHHTRRRENLKSHNQNVHHIVHKSRLLNHTNVAHTFTLYSCKLIWILSSYRCSGILKMTSFRNESTLSLLVLSRPKVCWQIASKYWNKETDNIHFVTKKTWFSWFVNTLLRLQYDIKVTFYFPHWYCNKISTLKFPDVLACLFTNFWLALRTWRRMYLAW
jgi:hypothetical protein